MTFFRQLLIAVVGLALCLLAGSLLINFNNTREFLQSQLQSHAQDTATHLGLTVSAPAQSGDIATMNSMVNAIFDRGYYREITIQDNAGRTLSTRNEPVRVKGVPPWFIELISLDAPVAESMVMDGWRQLGVVRVASHPGYAYRELWRSVRNLSLWFGLAALAAVLLGGLMLKILFRPLARIESQAKAISDRRYEVQEPLPKTRELRRVVEAMNRMVARVRSMFDEQAQTAVHLKTLAFHDPLTGLDNRRAFEQQLTAKVGPESEQPSGVVMLAQLNGLCQLNERAGYAAGDAFLRAAAEVLGEEIGSLPSAHLARLGGGDFAVLLPGMILADGEALATVIASRLAGLKAQEVAPHTAVVHVGVVSYRAGIQPGAVLAEADLALRGAQSQGENAVFALGDDALEPPAIIGRAQWRDHLERIIAEQEIQVDAQSAVAIDNRQQVLHRELLARIPTAAGDPLPAGIFMPMAEQLGLADQFDLAVIRLACESAEQDNLSINLSAATLECPGSLDELYRLVSDRPDLPRMTFEMSEHAVVGASDLLAGFVSKLRDLGHGFALDHFGRVYTDFAHMHALRPDYVKIDRSLLVGVDENLDAQFLVRTLCSVAHSLEVVAIVEGLESEGRLETLRRLGVDGVQGYVIERPQRYA